MKIIFPSLSRLFILFTGILVSGLTFCSVVPEKKNPEKKYFLITHDSSRISKGKKIFDYIKINKFRISPYYESKGLVYKRTEVSFESDFYNEFLTFPVSNITEIFSNWVLDSNIGILAPNVAPEEKLYQISGNVKSLYGDLRDSKSPKSVLEIDLYVQRASDSAIIYKKLYQKNIKADKANPEDLMKGWNQAITEILLEFEADLRKIDLKQG